ncbi:NAD(P)-dependent oxidoreductase [Quadrisphaera setariae]|uniref:NAD(P)-dependent oxidoreductase n=2 Tax=Quadrisphaera setariae TaxID=2593304 RepID=A0A5C8ZCU9_9ACTN|nr:NAD(P)-dependent oxidoreductase [Quadrisphaera setariae]
MVRALLAAGWAVTVSDLDAGRVQRLVDEGARAAGSPADLAGCDVLLLAVSDDAAVTAVLEGDDDDAGWLAGGGSAEGGADRLVVVHSTVLPATAVRLEQVARERGVALLDAPVSGGAERAARGDLTVFVGGDADAVELGRPLLDAVGSRVLHVGPAGAGAATKLANQLMMLSALAGAHEAVELAAAYQVDEATVLDAVSSSTGGSWVASNWGFFDATSAAYDEAGTPRRERPWSKDLFEVVEAGRSADLRLPVAALLSQVLADRVEAHAEGARS